MLIGERPASKAIQVIALLLAVPGGLAIFFALGLVLAALLPPICGPFLLWLSIAGCAYFLAAPATWRGLWRRALSVLGASLLTFAALGYLLAFAGLPAGGMPDLGPLEQLLILGVGLGATAWFLALRDRPRRAAASTQRPEPPQSPPLAAP